MKKRYLILAGLLVCVAAAAGCGCGKKSKDDGKPCSEYRKNRRQNRLLTEPDKWNKQGRKRSYNSHIFTSVRFVFRKRDCTAYRRACGEHQRKPISNLHRSGDTRSHEPNTQRMEYN